MVTQDVTPRSIYIMLFWGGYLNNGLILNFLLLLLSFCLSFGKLPFAVRTQAIFPTLLLPYNKVEVSLTRFEYTPVLVEALILHIPHRSDAMSQSLNSIHYARIMPMSTLLGMLVLESPIPPSLSDIF